MNLALLAGSFMVLLTLAYIVYGRWLSRQFKLNAQSQTPAHTKEDGIDFVPTQPFYLFGQHFSAIAAAGPIAGPIVACQLFGWLPAMLWIALGVVMIGAVHDFVSLAASVRHEAQSIAEIAKKQISTKAGLAMLGFIWVALLYIIVAFTDITASSFVSVIEELEGANIDFNPGGAVAASSCIYLFVALLMGLTQRFLKPPLWLLTLIFVPAAFAASWMGTEVSTYFILPVHAWAMLILVYCAIGTVVPVWLLLQPRGFLGGFILYFALIVGMIGIFFGGYEIQQPAFKGWVADSTGAHLFPFLFVTIACGACSGFHGLVCSGTTSKQIDRETHVHPIGYGAMLAEGFVAFIALAIIMVMTTQDIQGLKPGTIYGNGIGQFLTIVIGKQHLNLAITLGAMAFSTFVFDTLDVSARLGRYLVQELTGLRGRTGQIIGTVLTLGIPAVILFYSGEGAWLKYWTLFGASNQLLAALTLLAVTCWLYEARQRIAYTLLPMCFVLTITLWALVDLTVSNFKTTTGLDVAMVNGIASSTLIVLAIFINIEGIKKLRRRDANPATGPFQV